MASWLERYFRLAEHGTNVRTEAVAGATTFLTMAYIVFVNPQILADAGMPFGAAFVATCVSAAIATLVMGLYANYPIALAPGMGLNAYFSYGVVGSLGYRWEVALGAAFIAGTLFLALSVLPVRRRIIDAVPHSLKLAISVGIGLFLAVIALRNAGVIGPHAETMVAMRKQVWPEPTLALLGFGAIIALAARRVAGAAIIGILGITAAGVGLGVADWKGFVSLPPDPSPALGALDIVGALEAGMLSVIVTFLIVDLFDTAGTLIGVAQQADLLDGRGHLPRIERALIADSTGTVAGAVLGTSPVTSYVESAAGVGAGGRTGLTSVVTASLFLGCLLMAPLVESIPAYATAPAILYVACLMAKSVQRFNWKDLTEACPAVVTAVCVPLTFSIADGIGIGMLAYVTVKAMAGRMRECPPALIAVASVFVAKFVWL